MLNSTICTGIHNSSRPGSKHLASNGKHVKSTTKGNMGLFKRLSSLSAKLFIPLTISPFLKARKVCVRGFLVLYFNILVFLLGHHSVPNEA